MVHSGARNPLDVGTVIAGTYAIERVIGRGGMGAVFLASHARLPGKKVAIKVLHADIADSESLARFRREAEIASRLGHANIVEVHDWNVLPDGTPYLVLEYLEGETLAARVARGPLTLEHTIAIVRQIGSALAAAHREGIVHRDLKPANVFLVPLDADSFPSERAKVLDFGISKIRGSQTIKTQDTSILGTPQYMSPEQALGQHDSVDARTDVFALGAMVYEMLSGRFAFGGASVPEVVFKVVYEQPLPLGQLVAAPPSVLAAVERALSKKADERFPDIVSFVEALSGQPLVTGRRSMAIAPGDGTPSHVPTAARVTGQDALAQTIGSGDHAAAAAVATAPTMATGSVIPPSPPPATPPTIPTVSQPGKRGVPMFWIVALVAIIALSAVAIVFLVTRPGDRSGAGSPPMASVTIDAAGKETGTDAAARAVVALDAGAHPAVALDAGAHPAVALDAGAHPAVALDAGAASHPPTPPRPPGPPHKDDHPTDDHATAPAAVSACADALHQGDDDEAFRCADAALQAHPGLPDAYLIRAEVYCDNGDQENAQASTRKLASHAALHKKALSYCAGKGFTLN